MVKNWKEMILEKKKKKKNQNMHNFTNKICSKCLNPLSKDDKQGYRADWAMCLHW